MKFDKNSLDNYEYVSLFYEELLFTLGNQDRQKYYLMWNMCRTSYDQTILLTHWGDKLDAEDDDYEYQFIFVQKCESIVSKYMSEAPRWIDLILK